MSYQVLARKWRPRDFEQLVGQAHAVRALVNALDADRLHHAYLFTGTRGVGKTTLARILAKCLNCESGVTSKPCGQCGSCEEIDTGRFVDLIEVDAASRSKVDETRELMDNVQFTPARGRYKVYLIDEVHMFSEKSFNALLKTLEEPPPHVKFLLATTDPQKLPVTVLSRCLKFNLKRLPVGEIAAHVERILVEEGVEFEAAAVERVARSAEGSMRDAQSLLDQAIAYGAGTVMDEATRAMLGTVDRSRVVELLDAVADRDAGLALEVVDAIASDAADYADVLGDLVNALHRVAVRQAIPGAVEPDPEFAEACARLAGRLTPEDVQLYYEIGLHGRRDLAIVPDPKLGLEMTVLRMLAFALDASGDPSPARAQADGTAPASASAGPSAPGTPHAAAAPAAPKTPTAPVTPAAPAAPVTPAASAAPATPATAERIADPASLTPEGWRDMVEGLALTGLAGELALNSSLVDATGRRVKLGLDSKHASLNARGAREGLRAALEARFGAPIEVEVQSSRAPRETPATERAREDARRRQAAIRGFEEDPRVQSLCATFDTRIDPDLVRLDD